MLQRNCLLLVKTCSNLETRNLSHSIAFIGLGNMGAKMASNLTKRGNNLKVYDISASTAQTIAHATVCASPKDASMDASYVITMLPNGETVRNAVLGPDGVLKSIPRNAILIDCSTVEPALAEELHKKVGNVGARFVDAPVSGGITGAAAGTLTFMVGGDVGDVEAVEPVLKEMGSRVLHCGKHGAGQVAKMCNNLVLAASMAATAEAMNLGIKLGLDPKTLASVINTSSGRCWSSDTYNPVPGVVPGVPSSNAYDGGFVCDLMAKDLALAEGAAVGCGAPVPLGAAAHQLYRTMIANGFGRKDFSVVYEFLKGSVK